MQGGRRNTGSKTTPMGGKQSTRMSSTPQPASATFKPNQWGQPATPGAGRISQPQPVVHRPVAATPDVPRGGSRQIANVDGAGLVTVGQQTGTPVQTIAPPKVVQSD
jgi:hypothetical protein